VNQAVERWEFDEALVLLREARAGADTDG